MIWEGIIFGSLQAENPDFRAFSFARIIIYSRRHFESHLPHMNSLFLPCLFCCSTKIDVHRSDIRGPFAPRFFLPLHHLGSTRMLFCADIPRANLAFLASPPLFLIVIQISVKYLIVPSSRTVNSHIANMPFKLFSNFF